ncbi:MAG TPA: RNA polymerase sigma factor RpoD/SigA, partial [Gemmatimonadaceae bacterium]|nr:RNA polymerase sigma factor RpoD/SigA [Gemmatimonadaceae bacterium]
MPSRAGVEMQARSRRDPAATRSGDALAAYLREIGRPPLLRREEEAALVRRWRAGDRDALDALICANLRFVVAIAKRYQHQGVPLPDLVSEGNLGLIRAAHRFDESRGIKFISYAVWWVRQAILQALAEQSRIVRVPLHQAESLYRLGRRTRALFQELGRPPTPAEIASVIASSELEVEQSLSLSCFPMSLDAPAYLGADGSLGELLAEER